MATVYSQDEGWLHVLFSVNALKALAGRSCFLLIATVCVSCFQDECESPAMKCEGNRLMKCGGGGSHWAQIDQWKEVLDCELYGATCQEGELIEFDPYSDYISRFTLSHGCAVDDVVCDGDTDLQCTEDNALILGCSYSHEPTAMIIAENKFDHPLCVERSNGLAGFAYLPGECESNMESTCLEGGFTQVHCDNGLWSSNGGNCARWHENSKCEATIDSDGYSTSYCVPIEQDTAE